MHIVDYFRLLKFRHHITFISVIVGAFAFAPTPSHSLLASLFIVYLSFNVLLYGGLYTLNDLSDLDSDREHPRKKNRPLPAGRISVPSAYAFALTFILAGLVIGYVCFGKVILLIYLAFFLINLFYTRVAKKIPYVELLVNSVTHALRFVLGIILVAAPIPYFLVGAVFLLAFGTACVRRILERDSPGWETRRALRHYTSARLKMLQVIALGLIVIISLVDYPLHSAWYAVIIVLYLVLAFGMYISRGLADYLKWVYQN
ncbi:MAG: UbiA family prenyltransferase [Candidatus Kerfeldbacteria bacterium]|nr:UbiA family prenyltransferase [Candidatus Kerfeldbacteria bacterium]